MQLHYVLEGRTLREADGRESDVTIFLAPDADERRNLQDTLGIDSHTVESALDPEETARLEHDANSKMTSIIWKVPDPRADSDITRFEVATVGIFIRPEGILLVAADDHPPLTLDYPQLDSSLEFVLRLMLATQQDFIARLRAIKRSAREIQTRLNRTLDNRELVRMFNLSEDLVYYVDAIDANGAVLTKVRNARSHLAFTEDDIDLLDDLVIDNEQLSRQGHIYTAVLGDLLDARASIVSNNMNVLIKNLTVVNVVFLPLGVIASMGGMSEYSRFLEEHGIAFAPGYAGFLLGLVAVGIVIYSFIRAWVDRHMGGNGP